MTDKNKCECNNQWCGSNISWTSKASSTQKDENNNQWTSTLKKSPEAYADNCHPEKHTRSK